MSVGVVNKTTGDRIQTAGDPLDKVGNLANLTTTAKDNAVNAINEVNAGLATKADITDLAPAFSTSTAYAVGQYVSYDGNIYKCTSAHSAGAWVAGDFTLVAVGSELSEINSNITTLGNNVASINKSARHYSIDANTPYVLDLSDIGSHTLLFAFSHPYGSANGAVGLYLASNGYTAGYGVENVLASQDITITKTGQKEFTITSTKSTLLTVLGGTS